ncbi:hypothetical protein [Actinacidiphila acididurans]|uniref:Uncharacterized protein n=1 Tax=Actinacidiphila acididurans TaxID=2784346 RepID=A0ABS2TJB0_9ACTN|nr:hypothetical protein [Actinacidiphila acididurans]MBM9503086.1 hypothetical protein [Actinacidiphila acididurans]
MTTFVACDQVAADILAGRLTDVDFHERMTKRSATWQMGLPDLMRHTQTLTAIALLSAYPTAELPTAGEAARTALAVLRERNPTELFASIPAAVVETEPEIRRLRTISIGLTARSSLLRERIAETARNFLDPDAQYG